MKRSKFETSKDIGDNAECTDFILVDDRVYTENEIPFELVNELPEIIDEDMLYEEYRDRELFDRRLVNQKDRINNLSLF